MMESTTNHTENVESITEEVPLIPPVSSDVSPCAETLTTLEELTSAADELLTVNEQKVEVFLKYTCVPENSESFETKENTLVEESLSEIKEELQPLLLTPLVLFKTALLDNLSTLNETEKKFITQITIDPSHVILDQIISYSTKIKDEHDITSLVLYIRELLSFEKRFSILPVIKYIMHALMRSNILNFPSHENAIKLIDNSLKLLQFSVDGSSCCLPNLFSFLSKK